MLQYKEETMEKYSYLLHSQLECLSIIKKKAEEGLKKLPYGKLRVSYSHNSTQYYYLLPEDESYKYVDKKSMDIAKNLAQREYFEKVLRYVNLKNESIQRILNDEIKSFGLPESNANLNKQKGNRQDFSNTVTMKNKSKNTAKAEDLDKRKSIASERTTGSRGWKWCAFDYEGLDNVYYSLHGGKQKLVTPILPTWDQQVEKWLSEPFRRLGFREGVTEIFTENGLRVRSKSEKTIAEYLDRAGIPYKYECETYLSDLFSTHPDFTILNRKTRHIIIWEHFGLMDNQEYARNAVIKLDEYQKHGYIIGVNLIATFETEKTVLSNRMIEAMVNEFLL